MSRNSNILLAFITGAAAGATLGILYAPDKGKNTRDKLSFQLEKQKEKLQKLIDDLLDGKKEPATTAKTEGEKVTKDTIQKAEALLSEIDALSTQFKAKGKS